MLSASAPCCHLAVPLVTVGSFSLVPGRWMDGAGPLAASCGTGLSCFDWGLQAAPRLRWTPDRDDVREVVMDFERGEVDLAYASDILTGFLWSEAAWRFGRYFANGREPVNLPAGLLWPPA